MGREIIMMARISRFRTVRPLSMIIPLVPVRFKEEKDFLATDKRLRSDLS